MLISIAITLISVFQLNDSSVNYSMPIDKDGRLVSLELMSDSTFRFYIRTFEITGQTDWYTVHTTVNGTFIRQDNRIVFAFRGREVQKYKFRTHSANKGYTWMKLSDTLKCPVNKNADKEIIPFTIAGETYPVSRSLKIDSALFKVAGFYTTVVPGDSDNEKDNEVQSRHHLNLAPSPFFTGFGYGHYFCLEYDYTDFEGGSVLHKVEGTYMITDGKLKLFTVLYSEQNDAPLSGMTEKTLIFKRVEIECTDNGSGQIRLKHPSYSGFVFMRVK